MTHVTTMAEGVNKKSGRFPAASVGGKKRTATVAVHFFPPKLVAGKRPLFWSQLEAATKNTFVLRWVVSHDRKHKITSNKKWVECLN